MSDIPSRVRPGEMSENDELRILRERCARQRELIRQLRAQIRQLEKANERIIDAQMILVRQISAK